MGTSCPSGYVQADGSSKILETNPNLAKALSPDGQTPATSLPDLRGQFLRGADIPQVDTGLLANTDPDRTGPGLPSVVGSVQMDQLQNHQHKFNVGNESDNWQKVGMPGEDFLITNGGYPMNVHEFRNTNVTNAFSPTSDLSVTPVSSVAKNIIDNGTGCPLDNQGNCSTASGNQPVVVNSGSETRPKNVAVLYCIKL